MNRRFLNLVLHDHRSSVCSLHRMDLRNLFYNTAEIEERAAQEAKAKKKNLKLGALPPLTGLLRKPFVISCRPNNFFTLLRESTIMMAESSGRTALLDTDFKCILTMGPMDYDKGPNCVCFSTPDPDPFVYSLNSRCLFVLDLVPGSRSSSFEVLNYFGSNLSSQLLVSSHYKRNWNWRTLPVPPFLDDPAYATGTATKIKMCSSMLLGGSTICVSSMQKSIGTYTFDTARSEPEWSQARSWVLPFCGKAEYVPDLKPWFALSASTSSPHSICALDLPAEAIHLESPTELQRTWDYLDLPDSPYRRHLVNLGSGKFCVVSFFKTSTFNAVREIIKDESAVLTGLEVRRCNGAEGSVRMIKHMSKRYRFQKYVIHCVI